MDTTTVKDESNMTIEEKRREARKKRINSNTTNRLSYIQSHTPELKNEPEPEPEIKQGISELMANGKIENGSTSSSESNVLNFKSIFEQQRTLKDPLSFTLLRWIGIIFFALIFVSNSMLSSSPELLESPLGAEISNGSILQKYQWIFRILYMSSGNSNGIVGKAQSTKQMVYVYSTLLLVWLLWEYILVYRNRKTTHHNRQKTFLSFARSDALLIAFFYVTILDSILRWKQYIFPAHQLHFIKDNYLIDVLYYPLIIALIGQFIINYLSKSFTILHVDPRIHKVYQAVTHFTLSLVILLLCIDWWECSSIHCSPSSYGLLWLISSKSRGLFLWSHICINFASRIL